MSIHLAMLRAAGVLVPRQQRPEWLAEWTAELWHVTRVRESCAFAFCLGAFKDALWVRRNTRRSRLLESPLQCGLLLALLAAGGMLAVFLLPAARNAILPSPYRDPGSLVLITADVPINPAISFEDYQLLARRTQNRFSAVAFYGPARKRVGSVTLNVALASGNLFELLNISVAGSEEGPRLVLSDRAWRKYFDSDPHIAGRVVPVGGQRAVVAGIVSADSWRLPGRLDAWLLEDKKALAALPSRSRGFMLGHLRASGFRTLLVDNDAGGVDSYQCESLAARARQPLFSFLTALMCVCVFLPATVSLSLGEYRAAKGLRRWLFLSAKVACILAILYCCSVLAFAYSGTVPGAVCFLAMFPGSIFAFRWVLQDQRRRCPVCLRLLSKPVGFGEASHTFLGWYGTELTCVRGHGLLRVPEIPSTYFSTQRWLYRDDLLALRW